MQKRRTGGAFLTYPIPKDFPILFYVDCRESDDKLRPGPQHFHDMLEVAYCHEGTGLFTVGGKVMTYQAGDTIVITPDEPHYSQASARNRCVWTWCFFDPVRLLGGSADDSRLFDTSGLRGPGFHNLLSASQYPHIASLMRLLADEARTRRPLNRDAIRGCIRLLLSYFQRLPGQERAADGAPNDIERLHRLSPALDMVRARFADSLSVAALASACCMSGSAFRDHFRLCVGTSAYRYLQSYRVSMAKIALAHGGQSLRSIAVECGFPTLSSFMRAFRVVAGTTPRRWARASAEPGRNS
jgi:AraC-like DNA-binding protein